MIEKQQFTAALFGIVPGAAELLGISDSFLWVFWFGAIFIASYSAARMKTKQMFIAGATTGFLLYIVATVVKVAGFDLYIENNPEFVSRVAQLDASLDPQMYIALMGMITSVLMAIITGFLSLGMTKFIKK